MRNQKGISLIAIIIIVAIVIIGIIIISSSSKPGYEMTESEVTAYGNLREAIAESGINGDGKRISLLKRL